MSCSGDGPPKTTVTVSLTATILPDAPLDAARDTVYTGGVADSPDAPRAEPRTFAGLEHDWRRPTLARAKSRMWNLEDPRLFPPKSFGWGKTINFYWLFHPGRRPQG